MAVGRQAVKHCVNEMKKTENTIERDTNIVTAQIHCICNEMSVENFANAVSFQYFHLSR